MVAFRPQLAPALRLFCFPHAGGTYQAFSGWQESLAPGVEVRSFCYPGRLHRIHDPYPSSLLSMLPEIGQSMAEHLEIPFAFFGHSFGALVAFELARRLRARGPQPRALIVSALGAPQLPHPKPDYHEWSSSALTKHLQRLDGLPAAVAAHPEFLELMLRSVRADLRVHDTHAYEPDEPLDIPIVALGGAEDPEVTPTAIAAWRAQTSTRFRAKLFPGGHFFLMSHRVDVLAELKEELAQCLANSGRAAHDQRASAG